MSRSRRTLALVLGDQLDRGYPAVLGLDADRDVILMVEVAAASRAPASHVQRTVAFLSAMRHHAETLRGDGWHVEYVALIDPANTQTFAGELVRAVAALAPSDVAIIEPGAHRLGAELDAACRDAGVPLRVVEDPHFLCTHERFAAWAEGRKDLVMEYFYRAERRRLGVLLTDDGKPVGGAWNYDKENRKTFKREPEPPGPPGFAPDRITKRVIADVAQTLPDLPGRMGTFDWPVTRADALVALDDFIEHRLPHFGDYQDAMWTGQDTLYHSLLSVPLNLKLLDPREVYRAALDAYDAGTAPLNCVEGFVRQIIGWREFIRGVYFHEGPDYETRNVLEEHGALPDFYWTGETDMHCLREAVGSVLELSYGHHIARLMLTGNFAMIAGVDPRLVNDWYLGMYADGVDWVTAPNTLGMAMHADGGVVGTKPYAASGKYVQRMSNYCKSCRYDVTKRTGDDACPFNTFYWDFLIRHAERFRRNQRMTMILKNVERLSKDELTEITVSARARRSELGITTN